MLDTHRRLQPGIDRIPVDRVFRLQRGGLDLPAKIDERGEISQQPRAKFHRFHLLARQVIAQMPLNELVFGDASIVVGVHGVERLIVGEIVIDARLVLAEELRREFLPRVELLPSDETLIAGVEEVVQRLHRAQAIGTGDPGQGIDVLVEVQLSIVIPIVDVEHHREEFANLPVILPAEKRFQQMGSTCLRQCRPADEGEELPF